MKLRITGTQAECSAAVEALSAGFVLREVSTFYHNRGAAALGRVYVDAEPCPATDRAVGRSAVGPFGAGERAERDAVAARLASIEPTLVVRTARKAWTCTCSEGRNYLPSCTGEPITPGEVHVEYVGEAAAYSSGTRYHAACAVEAWTGPAAESAVVDLDEFGAARPDPTGGLS